MVTSSYALVGSPPTLYGLAGPGDLLATANSPYSANYRFGLGLAAGYSRQRALEQVGATVEGASTTDAVLQMARERRWHLPICSEVGELMAGRCSARQVLRRLMERDLPDERLQRMP